MEQNRSERALTVAKGGKSIIVGVSDVTRMSDDVKSEAVKSCLRSF